MSRTRGAGKEARTQCADCCGAGGLCEARVLCSRVCVMTSLWLLVLLCSPLCQPVSVESWGVSTVPSESECQPYIEKALKERGPQEAVDTTGSEQVPSPSSSDDREGSIEETEENNTKESKEEETDDKIHTEGDDVSSEAEEVTDTEEIEKNNEIEEDENVQGDAPADNESSGETYENKLEEESKSNESIEETEEGKDNVSTDQPSAEDGSESVETGENATQPEQTSLEQNEDDATAEEQSTETPDEATTEERSEEEEAKSKEETKSEEETTDDTKQDIESNEEAATGEDSEEHKNNEAEEESVEKVDISQEAILSSEDQGGEESLEVPGGEVTDSDEINESLEVTESEESIPNEDVQVAEKETTEDLTEEDANTKPDSAEESSGTDTSAEEHNDKQELAEEETEAVTEEETEALSKEDTEALTSTEETSESQEKSSPVTEEASEEVKEGSEASEEVSIKEKVVESLEDNDTNGTETNERDQESIEESSGTSQEQVIAEEEEVSQEQEPTNEDQLTLEFEAPKVRRPRDHITEILHLSPEAAESELMLTKTIESTLKELKKLYDAAIKPLEILFKYRDLSNRHFGDPEIFSKPLILFMGPWSGGKSTILNYLLDNEFKSSSLRTGAEPSPAYFNILMWGEREEVLDGTQLAADWTFSGLQKFGQGLLDRLRGLKLNSPLLEKVNIVEIPGILEIRKQVERLFPFNDACQWFIDRADIIFLVYDPSKLDVGPETEAILDQLKGREYQTRIILNKADQVKPEELMRVQGTLIWNISPLMSSTEPPVMYSTSLWSLPYEQGAPSRLLHAQERAFLRDLRQAIDKRVENKIASARRFAVRVRNHAKMVDCYLTTYYNHKSFFGNRKKVADDIIEQPQNYHIYEGLSTLTNISRYDLPDPEVYRDFFQLNPLYDFQRLSDTCTYFRGCPINRLDVAIAYDLPELVGKYRKQAEKVLETVAEKQATKS